MCKDSVNKSSLADLDKMIKEHHEAIKAKEEYDIDDIIMDSEIFNKFCDLHKQGHKDIFDSPEWKKFIREDA
jgi:hypothetical protein